MAHDTLMVIGKKRINPAHVTEAEWAPDPHGGPTPIIKLSCPSGMTVLPADDPSAEKVAKAFDLGEYYDEWLEGCDAATKAKAKADREAAARAQAVEDVAAARRQAEADELAKAEKKALADAEHAAKEAEKAAEHPKKAHK